MRTDDPDVAASAMVGLIGAILLVVTILALQAYYLKAKRSELDRKSGHGPPRALAELRRRQSAKLSGYRWVDPRRGVVAIPIERAMEMTARRLGNTAQPHTPEEP